MKLIGKFISIIFTIVFICWICLIVLEYIKFDNNEEPFLCIEKKTYEYEDGTVNECIGLGYKVINYNRSSLRERKFGPFWIKVEKSDVD